jgi:hypothetical protein
MTTETEFALDLSKELEIAQEALREIVRRSTDRNLTRGNGAVAAHRLGTIAKTALTVIEGVRS